MNFDTDIIQYVKANPGQGLFEISNALYEIHKDYYVRNPNPKYNHRQKISTRLTKLSDQGRLLRENPTGKKSIYFAVM